MKQKNAQVKAKTQQNGAQLQKITKSKGPSKPVLKKEVAKELSKPMLKKEVAKEPAMPMPMKEVAKKPSKPTLKKEVAKEPSKPMLKKEVAKGPSKPLLKKEVAKGPSKPLLKKEVAKMATNGLTMPKKPPQKKENKKESQSEEDDDEDNELEGKVKEAVNDRKKKSSDITDNSNDETEIIENTESTDDDSSNDEGENAESDDDDSSVDEDENAESDDDDSSNDEVENGDSDDDDSNDEVEIGDSDDEEEPIAVPNPKISKSSVHQDSPQKINTGNIPQDMPDEQVLVVTNLPETFKQIDIVEVFAKYGTLHTINPRYKPNSNIAYVAFTTADAAQMALAENQKATIRGQTIKVSIRKNKTKKVNAAIERQKKFEENKEIIDKAVERTMVVKKLKPDVTEEHLHDHFAPYGKIEKVILVPSKQPLAIGLVVYTDVASVEPAKKLHNTILCGGTISVRPKMEETITTVMNSSTTICLKNKQNLEAVAGDTLNEIFSKCGEITNVHILCRKNALAFVTFKNESDAQKALELSGTTVAGLELDIDKFKDNFAPKTSIFVYNVKPGVTEEEIRELFAPSGAISHVGIFKGYAIVRFEDADGFCKSFLRNEAPLQGQMIFIEPLSEKKQQFIKKRNTNIRKPVGRPNMKRPFPTNANANPRQANSYPTRQETYYPQQAHTYPQHANTYPPRKNAFNKPANSFPKFGNGFPKRPRQED